MFNSSFNSCFSFGLISYLADDKLIIFFQKIVFDIFICNVKAYFHGKTEIFQNVTYCNIYPEC